MIEFVSAVTDVPVASGEEATSQIVRGGRTKAKAIAAFAEALDFPSWFGHNLDALADLLDEYAAQGIREEGSWWLIWRPSTRLIADHPMDYRALVGVLTDVAEPRGRRVTVVGPQPSPACS